MTDDAGQPAGMGERPNRDSLELRDFFRTITFEQVRQLAIAIGESNSEPELEATLREAAEVIPLMQLMSAEVNERQAEGDVEQKRFMQGQLMALMCIYRLAEDMGYRW